MRRSWCRFSTARAPFAGRLALQLQDRLLEELHVEVEAHRLDVAALLAAQQVAGAAHLEVEGGDAEARAEVRELADGGEPLLRDLGEDGVRGHEEVGVGAAVGAADPAAELVELGEAVAVGAVHDEGVGARDVEAVLDDGGGHEHVGATLHEGRASPSRARPPASVRGPPPPAPRARAAAPGRPASRSTPPGCGRGRPGPRAAAPGGWRCAIVSVENFTIEVWMASRSLGGVSITDMSRIPARPIWSVRGMGVAERVRQSTVVRRCFKRSLAATPKRCSSSTTRRPRSLKTTSLESRRWVPMRMSILPDGEAGEGRLDLLGRSGSARPSRR